MIPERFRGRIEALLEPGFNSLEQIETLIGSGDAQAWWGRESAIIGHIEEFDEGAKVFRAVWGVGDLNEIRDEMAPRIIEWAKGQGCSSILVQGRDGWVRALQGIGFRPYQVVVRKDIA